MINTTCLVREPTFMQFKNSAHLYSMQSTFLRLSVLTVFVFLVGLTPVFAQADRDSQSANSVPSKLEKVTIYQQGALLTRTGSLTLKAGEQEIILEGLERNINPGSIQLAIDRSVGIFAVEYTRVNPKAGSEPDSLIKLRGELKGLRKVLAVNAIQQKGYDEEIEILKANRLIAQSETSGYSAASIREATQLHNELATAARVARLDLVEKATEINKDILVLEQRINAIRPNQKGAVGKIVAKVIAERGGAFNFELSYITNAASWSPNYDLYVQTEGTSKSQLVLAADIRQNTGIDWENVALTLSNTNINSRLTPPTLSPIFLGGNAEYNLKSQVAGTVQKRKQTAEEEVVYAPLQNASADVAYAATYATQSNSAAARLYEIDRPFSLVANGKSSSVKLTSNELPIDLRYRIVPKREQQAYLEAVITGWDTLNLLAAQTRTHLDGRYLGKTYLNTQQNSDTLTVGLGPDKRLVVKRTGRGQGSDTKFIRGKKEYNLGYQITLRNTRNVAIDVLVEDQIPVSQKDELTVELKNATGKPDLDEFTGKLTWKLSLKPAKEEKLIVNYQIVAPKNTPIRFE